MLTKRESVANEPPGDSASALTPDRASASAIVRTFIALLGNTGIQGVLGFVFLAVASRHVGDSAIKRNFTIIAFIRSIAPLMQAGLIDSAMRRLPTMARPGRFVLRLYGVVVVSATVLAAVYLIFGRGLFTFIRVDAPSWVPLLLVFGAATWGIVIVQDAALVALERSHVVPLESLVFGLLGIVLLSTTHANEHAYALLIVYLAPLPLIVLIGNAVLLRRLRTWQPATPSVSFTRGAEVRTWTADLLIMGMISAQRGLIPAIVAARVSDSSAAVFIAVYALTLAAHEGLAAVTTAFVARASRDPEDTMRPVITSLQLIMAIGIPMCLVTFIAAGPFLSIFAERYSDGAQFLRVMIAGAPFSAIAAIATIQARLRRQPSMAVLIVGIHTVFTFTGAFVVVRHQGINGFGYASLAGEALIGIIGLSYLNRTVLKADRAPADAEVDLAESEPVFAARRDLVPLTTNTALVTAFAFAIAAVAVVAAVADVSHPVIAPIEMLAMVVWPGFALRRLFSHTSPAFQAVIVTTVSVSVWLVLAETTLLVDVWQPRMLFVAIIAGSTLATVDGVVRRREFASIERFRRRVADSETRRSWRLLLTGGALLAGAVAGLIYTQATIDRTKATDIGLAGALSPVYWVGLICAASLFVGATFRQRVAKRTALSAIVIVTAYYHAIMPFATRLPRFFWTTRHSAVVDYITQNGSVNRNIDIYHNWPAFFGASSIFSSVSGANPLYYARWSHLVIMLLCLVALMALVEAFTHDARLQLTTMFLFVVGQWTGQEYFSPQAIAFFLLIALLAVVVRSLSAYRDAGPVSVLRRRLLEPLSRSASIRPDWAFREFTQATTTETRVGFAVGLLTYVAMAFSHQLTPYVAVLMLSAMVILRRVRAFWLLPAAYLALVGTLAMAYNFLDRSGINLLSFDLSPASKRGGGALFYDLKEQGEGLIVSRLTLLLVLVFILGAVVGLLRRLRSGFSELEAVLIIGCPPAVVLFQGYDGEGLYRAFLYALPALAYLLACTLLPRVNAYRLRSTRVAALVLCVSLAVLWPFVGYGREKTYGFFDDEVAASSLIEETAKPGSSIVAFSTGFPVRITARYGAIYGAGLTPLLLLPEVRDAATADEALATIHDLMARLDAQVGGDIYLVWSRSQENSADHYRIAERDRIQALVAGVAQSPAFDVVHSWDDAVVFRWHSAP
jgi:O-antigen/teichoic acid export membrane protein